MRQKRAIDVIYDQRDKNNFILNIVVIKYLRYINTTFIKVKNIDTKQSNKRNNQRLIQNLE